MKLITQLIRSHTLMSFIHGYRSFLALAMLIIIKPRPDILLVTIVVYGSHLDVLT